MEKARYVTRLDQVPQLSAAERERLAPVVDEYSFRSNTYYLGLIDWDDPDDPIRKIAIPTEEELVDWGRLDASDEHLYAKAPGLEHKYEFTALLLVSDVCGGVCRFCFRKRLFMDESAETSRDVSEGLKYIRERTQINNVLLTGGDPLMLSNKRLDQILTDLRAIDHVQIIRIGSKIPVFNPHRLLNDSELLDIFKRHSLKDRRLYLMVHFNHPRELTEEAIEGIARAHEAGGITANQTPLLRGVNDDPEVLSELFNKLSYIGVAPYYVFIGRPTKGNKHFLVPIEEALEIFEKSRMNCSGLAKRARLVMSHSTGKVHILGRTADHIYMRYHRAADPEQKGRFLVLKSNPEAFWLDDYPEAVEEYQIKNPFGAYGPD